MAKGNLEATTSTAMIGKAPASFGSEDDTQPNATESKDRHGGASLHFGGVGHGADARHDRATKQDQGFRRNGRIRFHDGFPRYDAVVVRITGTNDDAPAAHRD